MAFQPATTAAATKLVNTDILFSILDNLAARWKDEHKYEDIAEYGKVVAKKLPKEVSFVRMSKKPFGVVVRLPELDSNVLLYMKSKGKDRASLALTLSK